MAWQRCSVRGRCLRDATRRRQRGGRCSMRPISTCEISISTFEIRRTAVGQARAARRMPQRAPLGETWGGRPFSDWMPRRRCSAPQHARRSGTHGRGAGTAPCDRPPPLAAAVRVAHESQSCPADTPAGSSRVRLSSAPHRLPVPAVGIVGTAGANISIILHGIESMCKLHERSMGLGRSY